ncbi:MAG: carbamoyltransferase N-terminal domain-containing protein [Vicinamibacterales bacterium]
MGARRCATLYVGISSGRDAAVALFDGERLIAAVEEEKLSRTRTDTLFPATALRFCLQDANVSLDDVSLVALSNRPRRAWLREQQLRARWGMLPVRKGFGGAQYIRRELRRLGADGDPETLNRRFQCYEHHRCHAASAFYPSPFDRALVLSMDGAGDMLSGLAMLGEGSALRQLASSSFPDSLGWLYSQITELLGFRPRHEEQKVQWLSSRGVPLFLPQFRKLIKGSLTPFPQFDRRYLTTRTGRWKLSSEFIELLGARPLLPVIDPALSPNIARSLQDFLEETVVGVAERLRLATGTDYLCLAGGLFLNTFLVRALEERTGYRRVFVQPAAGNAGAAVGAAYLAGYSQSAGLKRHTLPHVHLGPGFDSTQIKAVLDNCKLIYRYYESEERLIGDAVALLLKGQSVAWFQDRLEFGFRALGNRSILGSPFSPYLAENLNHFVKHRDESHPFLLSVPAESAADLFDCTDNCDAAASVGRLKESIPHLERFIAGERRVRVHTVQREVNPRLWKLLRKFGEAAPGPLLVNTSFNLFGEPLVCDPRDAVRSFFCAGIDALVMGNFVVVK